MPSAQFDADDEILVLTRPLVWVTINQAEAAAKEENPDRKMVIVTDSTYLMLIQAYTEHMVAPDAGVERDCR